MTCWGWLALAVAINAPAEVWAVAGDVGICCGDRVVLGVPGAYRLSLLAWVIEDEGRSLMLSGGAASEIRRMGDEVCLVVPGPRGWEAIHAWPLRDVASVVPSVCLVVPGPRGWEAIHG